MSRCRIAKQIVILIALLAGAGHLPGGEQPTVGPSVRSTAEPLIARLKSPNKPANPGREPFIGYPAEYDFEKQKQVLEAERKLVASGKNAFPVLIEHMND